MGSRLLTVAAAGETCLSCPTRGSRSRCVTELSQHARCHTRVQLTPDCQLEKALHRTLPGLNTNTHEDKTHPPEEPTRQLRTWEESLTCYMVAAMMLQRNVTWPHVCGAHRPV
ncbi:hypothetical protein AAFF_G00202570 [Aldrovandia affinis]|uniref:Uncharacterized protein n=1 Tax=Aldrovandia affinis TaxID=143900 RepID=A0AAD7WUS2_9TELE|nr:hypothetical protein AAFF_G00202570 [Aldrovandia affinis]